jgi:hypothetical protein
VAIGWISRPDAFINPIELTGQEETDSAIDTAWFMVL